VLQKHGMLGGKLGDEIIQLIEQRLKYVEAMEKRDMRKLANRKNKRREKRKRKKRDQKKN
jgi:hypothetical protein